MNDIISGDTYKTSLTLVGYSPDDYTAKLLLRGPAALQVDGISNGEGWDFTISATQTTILSPGTYSYAIRVFRSNEAYTRAQGTLMVRANPADTTPKVVFAEKMIAAIERVLEGQLSGREAVAISAMSVGGRSLTLLDRSELLEERARWIRTLKKLRGQPTGVVSKPVNTNSILGNRP
jgi:hypothetical protein